MPAANIHLEWVNPPLQIRSQQTLVRLLDAAEAIISERGIDSATIADIARQAGSSVGAFYTRFADKEALVRCLLARFHEQAVATAGAVLVPERWEGVAVEDALETMILFMLRILRERRALILALMQRAPGDAELTAYGRRLHEAITERMQVLIERRGHVVSHADGETAVRVAVWLVLSAMESRALYADGNPLQLPDDVVAHEMAQMVVRYVGVDRDEEATTMGRAAIDAARL